jgi:hypothetical protein
MPTPTYTPLATVTLGSTAASVTFSSIPATYRDLIVVVNGTTTASVGVTFRHNGDTTDANYTSVNMTGNGSTATSTTATNANMMSMFTTQTQGIVQFLDYSATDKHKTGLSRGDNAGNNTRAFARRWSNTAAITSIEIAGGTFNSGSTFSLYGVIA